MYSTCLHCSRPLGTNRILESFPVGRRLAFDARLGRLWVVCPSCSRWNLTPLEERWEAIEEAERLFRSVRTRVSTDEVGLARMADGTDLVRIGEPQRPEFAAWRYGEVFRRRHRRAQLVATASIAGVVAYAAGTIWGVAAMGSALPMLFVDFASLWGVRRSRRVIERIETPKGVGLVRGSDARFASLSSDGADGIAMRVSHSLGMSTLTGDRAVRLLGRTLPILNREGGDRESIQEAVRRIEEAGSSRDFVRRALRAPLMDDQEQPAMIRTATGDSIPRWSLAAVRREELLALEMSLHEETERAAMEGDLAALEAAWRDAEEIAAIADNLLVPASVSRALQQLRGGAPDEGSMKDPR